MRPSPCRHLSAHKPRADGFSLIEIMIALVVVSVLTAIVLPMYRDHVQRARLADSFSALGGVQLTAEQYWANNRTYVGLNPLPVNTDKFTYSLDATATAYTVTATGVGELAGFVYTINQNGQRATTGVPAGWTASATCWVDQKSGKCTQ